MQFVEILGSKSKQQNNKNFENNNNFDPKLRSTVDLLKNEVPHFLDLELSPDGISTFRRNINTDLYTHFGSYVPWFHRTTLI